MNDITNRFLEVYQYLIDAKEVSNQADFTQKIKVSGSMFTEISKGRSNVGLTAIQNTVDFWDWINPRYILNGKGSLDLRLTEKAHTPADGNEFSIVSEPNPPVNAPPTKRKNAPPTAPPTLNLGMPKVVTVNERNDDLITLVNAKAAAGYLNGYADPEYIEKLPTLYIPNLKGGTHRAFEITGNSMPTTHHGSIAIGRWVESLDDIKENYVYIIVTKSDGIVEKRVLNRIKDNGVLILKSDNQNKREYPNRALDVSEVLEVWRWRGAFIFEIPEPNELNHKVNDLEARFTLMEHKLQNLLK